MKLFRLVRLTRMARLLRILRALPELLVLVKGMMVAFRAVFFTTCLLLLATYMFAILLTQISRGMDVGVVHFPSVVTSMKSMLIAGVVPDLHDILHDVGSDS